MQNKKVRDILDWLETAELYKLLYDLEHGSMHLKHLVAQKINERNTHHQQLCTMCSSEINQQNTNTYTLIFGPHDFRKKATFCGLDCMESFITHLKEIKH